VIGLARALLYGLVRPVTELALGVVTAAALFSTPDEVAALLGLQPAGRYLLFADENRLGLFARWYGSSRGLEATECGSALARAGGACLWLLLLAPAIVVRALRRRRRRMT